MGTEKLVRKEMNCQTRDKFLGYVRGVLVPVAILLFVLGSLALLHLVAKYAS